jgi:hypothetical protein
MDLLKWIKKKVSRLLATSLHDLVFKKISEPAAWLWIWMLD